MIRNHSARHNSDGTHQYGADQSFGQQNTLTPPQMSSSSVAKIHDILAVGRRIIPCKCLRGKIRHVRHPAMYPRHSRLFAFPMSSPLDRTHYTNCQCERLTRLSVLAVIAQSKKTQTEYGPPMKMAEQFFWEFQK